MLSQLAFIYALSVAMHPTISAFFRRRPLQDQFKCIVAALFFSSSYSLLLPAERHRRCLIVIAYYSQYIYDAFIGASPQLVVVVVVVVCR